MLVKEFKMWLADFLFVTTLIIGGMYITNLSYLKDGFFCFTEHLDSSTEMLNRILIGLDTAAVISKMNNQDLLNLIDSKAE